MVPKDGRDHGTNTLVAETTYVAGSMIATSSSVGGLGKVVDPFPVEAGQTGEG